MKIFFLSFLLSSVVINVQSQNQPAPAYLTTQHFPDSVLSVGMRTIEDQKISFGEMLEKHKGKKIFLDIWASWCRDCIVGYPSIDKLRNNVGDGNIVYVFLSTDKDAGKWIAAIEKFNIRGEHYLLNGAWQNALSNYVSLDWVPRYLVLDENGNVIMPKAIVADDVALRTALQR
jgi:thiol-disulfide isomerase/thioredoxin